MSRARVCKSRERARAPLVMCARSGDYLSFAQIVRRPNLTRSLRASGEREKKPGDKCNPIEFVIDDERCELRAISRRMYVSEIHAMLVLSMCI